MEARQIVMKAVWIGAAFGVVITAVVLVILVSVRLRAVIATAGEPPDLELPFGFC